MVRMKHQYFVVVICFDAGWAGEDYQPKKSNQRNSSGSDEP